MIGQGELKIKSEWRVNFISGFGQRDGKCMILRSAFDLLNMNYV